uniref:C2H2-type domain-containing protein n=1 Tax=Anopheles merus TaxID=30066 RepID=A0A182V2M8_ANOME
MDFGGGGGTSGRESSGPATATSGGSGSAAPAASGRSSSGGGGGGSGGGGGGGLLADHPSHPHHHHHHHAHPHQSAGGGGGGGGGATGGSAGAAAAVAVAAAAAVAGLPVHTCMYCGVTFHNQNKLTRHILSHSLESLKFREATHLLHPHLALRHELTQVALAAQQAQSTSPSQLPSPHYGHHRGSGVGGGPTLEQMLDPAEAMAELELAAVLASQSGGLGLGPV